MLAQKLCCYFRMAQVLFKESIVWVAKFARHLVAYDTAEPFA